MNPSPKPSQLDHPKPIPRLLIIEASPAIAGQCLDALKRAGLACQADIARTPQEASACLAQANYDLVLADWNLPGGSGRESLEMHQQLQPNVPFIALTALDEREATDLRGHGVTAFVARHQPEQLPAAVRRALAAQEAPSGPEPLRAATAEIERLEGELRRLRRATTFNAVRAGLAHELKNTLTVITGNVGTLQRESTFAPGQREALQNIARAADLASRLVSEGLAGPETPPAAPERIDVNKALGEMSALLRCVLRDDITLDFQHGAKLPPLLCSPTLLRDLVVHLAVNSRGAMREGGVLLISTAVTNDAPPQALRGAAPRRQGPFICLTFSDTGAGVNRTELDRKLKTSAAMSEAPEKPLPLATCAAIVKELDGWMEAQSHVSRGSTYRVYLPAAEPKSDQAGAARLRARGETILAVEDDAAVRWTVKTLLERQGYHVLEASNGIEALAIWHQHQKEISLLLTDMIMPNGLNGQELAQQFQSQYPELKVLFTSGYSPESAGKDFTSLSGVNFIQKPFDAVKLAEVVRRTLDA